MTHGLPRKCMTVILKYIGKSGTSPHGQVAIVIQEDGWLFSKTTRHPPSQSQLGKQFTS